jgi:1,5-anhydro-D-fructose reductase (1,5-anhydro-D-mannitol-forming)
MAKKPVSKLPHQLGWGLIGASDIARSRMIPAINSFPDSKVVAVFSHDPERAKSYARENGIPKAYSELTELLADPAVDVVYVSTTNEKHRDEVIAAAQAGKHVLCEKPLALTLEDALAMKDACTRAGVILGTNHHLRNSITHRVMRQLVREGAIGRVLAARVFHAVHLPKRLRGWRINSAEAGGGVIFDITVHDADVLYFALGLQAEEVVALAVGQGLSEAGLEDDVMGVIRFPDSVLAQFHDAFTIKHGKTGLEIYGTEGALIGDEVMTQEPKGTVVLRREDKLEKVPLHDPEDLYAHQVRHFTAAIRGTGTPFTTADDGIRSLAVALAVRESVATERAVRVRYS